MKVNLKYFKDSGKYYCDGEFECLTPYLFEIIKHVKYMRDINQNLPGLTGSWEGDILITTLHPSLGGIFLLKSNN